MSYVVLRESNPGGFGSDNYYAAVQVGVLTVVTARTIGEQFGPGNYLILGQVGWERYRVSPSDWKLEDERA